MCKSFQSLLQLILILRDTDVLFWKPDLIKVKSDSPRQLLYNSYEELSATVSRSSPSMSPGTDAKFGLGWGAGENTHVAASVLQDRGLVLRGQQARQQCSDVLCLNLQLHEKLVHALARGHSAFSGYTL